MSDPSPLPTRARPALSPTSWVLLLLGVATALKILWATHSVGSYDAAVFYLFAKELHRHSLAWLYDYDLSFNHLPLTAFAIERLYTLVGGEYRLFAGLFRLVCTIGDFSVVLGLLQLRTRFGGLPWWALAAMAANPVSLMLSGFHGNVDPLLTALLFWAAYFYVIPRPAWSGAFFAAACSLKIVPIPLAPIFLVAWGLRDRRALAWFCAAAAAVFLPAMVLPLVQCPALLARNVFSYGGYWGVWGFTYWLRMTGAEAFEKVHFTALTPAQNGVMLALKLVSVAGVLTLAWRRRAVTAPLGIFTTLAAALVVIYVFAPAGAVQYLAWFGPFLLVAAPRSWALATAAATVYLVAFYACCAHGPFPWFAVFPKTEELESFVRWANVPWVAFIVVLGWEGRRWFLLPAKGATSAEGGLRTAVALA